MIFGKVFDRASKTYGNLLAQWHGRKVQSEIARRGLALMPAEAMTLLGRPGFAFVDLRDRQECERYGQIPGSLHTSYAALGDNIREGGFLHELARSKRVILYCALGKRSALAVETAQASGLTNVCHIHGGLAAWKRAEGPVVP